VIVVVYSEQADDLVRIISARMATQREQALFRRHLRGEKR
jgi:uncharacterized DUF497 family protein